MINFRKLIFLVVAALYSIGCHAQKKIDMRSERSALGDFVNEMTSDFDNFRRQTMAQFAEFVKNPWKEFDGTPPVPKPDPKPVPPVIMEDKDREPPVEDKPIVIEEVVEPVIEVPQPEPIEPIEEVPVVKPSYVDFSFFGTADKVRCPDEGLPVLGELSEKGVAEMLQKLTGEEFDNLILDCLTLRNERSLCDWAYLMLLDKVANSIYPDHRNEAEVLLAYLYIMSGYKARLASDGNRVYMLFGTRHQIYDRPGYLLDGERFYSLRELPERLNISLASFPQEQSLSLLVPALPQIALDMTDKRTITSERYPEMKFDVAVNRNLLDFYSTYPTSAFDDNIMTRWAMYANAPMDGNVSSTLYPALKEILKDKTELEATNILLNALQTGLTYEYDNVVWGGDRAFFSEESLFYPYCDCEDRAILLTRLVRDLLDLRCILVFYPGHLAAAIEYPDQDVRGDYIDLDGHRFIIADPTYINAPIGYTMPDMDNATAKAILLD